MRRQSVGINAKHENRRAPGTRPPLTNDVAACSRAVRFRFEGRQSGKAALVSFDPGRNYVPVREHSIMSFSMMESPSIPPG
jgi:hypothetical protein